MIQCEALPWGESDPTVLNSLQTASRQVPLVRKAQTSPCIFSENCFVFLKSTIYETEVIV